VVLSDLTDLVVLEDLDHLLRLVVLEGQWGLLDQYRHYLEHHLDHWHLVVLEDL
jgi:hypothetical protein